MADLFLSYAREDRDCAELFARALEQRGFTVWWDRRIQVGRSFSEVIEYELEQAHCVLVLWSRHSVASEWVQSEAAEAARRRALVPVRIEDVRPPLEFRRLHTADLFDWRHGFTGQNFDACIASIDSLTRRSSPAENQTPLPRTDPTPQATPAAYWISQDGQQFGARDAAMLRQWADEGRIRADSFVYDPALQRWTRAREISYLQSAYRSKPTPTRTVPDAAPPDVPAKTGIWITQDDQLFPAPDSATLRQWAEEGRVRADSHVYDMAKKKWIRARERPELRDAFDKKQPDPPPQPKPPAPQPRVEPAPQPAAPAPEPTSKRRALLIAGIGLVGILSIIAISIASSRPTHTTTDTQSVDTSTTTSSLISVSVENQCADKAIDVAICYRNASGTWIVEGWFRVRANETRRNLVQASDPRLYFYGMSGNLTWPGDEKASTTIVLPINKTAAFEGPYTQLTGSAFTKVPFFGSRADAGRSTYLHSFWCNRPRS